MLQVDKKIKKRKTFTDQAVKVQKTKTGKQEEIADAIVPGLKLRVGPSSRVWYFIWGRSQKIKIGAAGDGAISLSRARELATNYRNKVLAGVDPRAAAGDQAPRTLKELADLYIKLHAKLHRRSWAADKGLLELHVFPKLGGRQLLSLQARDIAQLTEAIPAAVRERREKLPRRSRFPLKISPTTGERVSGRVLGLLRSIFRWGLPLGFVSADLTAGIKKKGMTGGRDRVLDDVEISKFLHALPSIFEDEQRQIVIRLLLLLGSRKSEVLEAERSELHLDGPAPFWLQPKARVKNKHDHVVPLAPAAVALFRRAIEISKSATFVFANPNSGETYAPTAVHKRLRDAFCEGTVRQRLDAGYYRSVPRGALLGGEAFTVHDLRRSVATGMARLKIDRVVIGKVLNHRSVDAASITGLIYDRHSYAEEKREALTRWAAHIEVLDLDRGKSTAHHQELHRANG
jgi:integrase